LTNGKDLKATLDTGAGKVEFNSKDLSVSIQAPVVQNDYFKSTYGEKMSIKTLSSNELFTIDTNTKMNKGPSTLLKLEVTTDYKKAVKEQATVAAVAAVIAGLVFAPEITVPILGGGAKLAPSFQ
jgi:hypothetical protein